MVNFLHWVKGGVLTKFWSQHFLSAPPDHFLCYFFKYSVEMAVDFWFMIGLTMCVFVRLCCRGEQPLPVTVCQSVHPQQPGPSGPLRECPPWRRHAGMNRWRLWSTNMFVSVVFYWSNEGSASVVQGHFHVVNKFDSLAPWETIKGIGLIVGPCSCAKKIAVNAHTHRWVFHSCYSVWCFYYSNGLTCVITYARRCEINSDSNTFGAMIEYCFWPNNAENTSHNRKITIMDRVLI